MLTDEMDLVDLLVLEADKHRFQPLKLLTEHKKDVLMSQAAYRHGLAGVMWLLFQVNC